MTLERMAFPLMVAGAIAGIWAFLRRPSMPVDTTNIGYQGYDPGTWTGRGVGETEQYFSAVPNYALDPGYVASAVGNPWAQDPEADSAIDTQLSGDGSSGVPSYITYNSYGNSNPPEYGPAPAKDACGCGGCGCDSKCGCDSGVSFFDGASCLVAENSRPWQPAGLPIGAYYGYAPLGDFASA